MKKKIYIYIYHQTELNSIKNHVQLYTLFQNQIILVRERTIFLLQIVIRLWLHKKILF